MADHDHDHSDETFEASGAGSAQEFPQQCSALRKNGYVNIKGCPCKIVEMSTSKTGKHGHAKVHMVAINIFNGKKLEEICPSTHNMNVPNVTRKEYQLIDVNDEFASLMDDDGNVRDDLKLNLESIELPADCKTMEDLKRELDSDDSNIQAEVLKAMGDEVIKKLKKTN